MPSVPLPSLLQPQVRCVRICIWLLARGMQLVPAAAIAYTACLVTSLAGTLLLPGSWSDVLQRFIHSVDISGLQAIYS